MKRLVTLFSALFLVAGLVSAQTADSTIHRGMGNRKMAMRHFGRQNSMARLNLTDDQKSKMKSVNEDYRKQLSALQNDNNITLGEYKTQLAALQKSHREKVNNVFTSEQKKIMADRRKNMKTHMQARGAANLEKMKQNLGLSDDQVAKIKGQREEMRTQLQILRSDSTLLPEQKREKVRELFAKQREGLKTVLTPDQLTKLQSMQKERMNHERGMRHGVNDQAK
ncbi:MAG TPA: hypothetical protein VG738_04255 [Chitinophagaceae bacterium]|nr:hypothetical protein [Chitinophagaceae bacterium]